MGRRNRFSAIPRKFDGCVYVAELKNGLVKVGFSRNPRTRMGSLANEVKRKYRTTLQRWHVSQNIPCHRFALLMESVVISRMGRIGTACNGTQEYFQNVAFGAAVTLVNQMAST